MLPTLMFNGMGPAKNKKGEKLQTTFLCEKAGLSKTVGWSYDLFVLMCDFGILTSCYYLHSPWFFDH